MHITRIAPSPTGDFHIGSARTAYFNWLAARASGGLFHLRIDDTDAARGEAAAEAVIHDSLAWLGLAPDSVTRQSERVTRHLSLAGGLVSAGRARVLENGAIALRDGVATPWTDLVGGTQTPGDKHRELAGEQIIVRGDGTPVFHFASVVDDIDMGVTLVIRGMDHHVNTYRHTAIYRALGAPLPVFAHVGLITEGGKKISKRDAAASLLSYRDAGIDPDAMLNLLLRMGWGPSVDDRSTALIDRDRALELFLDGGRMRAAPAALDRQKLASFDRKHRARKARAT